MLPLSSIRKSRSRLLFDAVILPLLRQLGSTLSEIYSLELSFWLDEELLCAFGTKDLGPTSHLGTSSNSVVNEAELEERSLNAQDLLYLFVHDNQAAIRKGELTDLGKSYRNAFWLPRLGLFTLRASFNEPCGIRSPEVSALRELLRGLIGMCLVAVDWQQIGETLVHEILVTLMACTTDAERLLKLGRKGSDLQQKDLDQMKTLSEHLGSEALMGVWDLENLLSRLAEQGTTGGTKTLSWRTRAFIWVDLWSELRSALDKFSGRARLKGVQFRISGTPEKPLRLKCDPLDLKRLFYNLINNAVKYSYHSRLTQNAEQQSGDYDVRFIRVALRFPHGTVGIFSSITIENYGVGLLPGEEKLVTLPGYRGILAEAESRRGAGIGLSEAHRIATRLGGKLNISSKSVSDDRTESAPHLFTVTVVLPVET